MSENLYRPLRRLANMPTISRLGWLDMGHVAESGVLGLIISTGLAVAGFRRGFSESAILSAPNFSAQVATR
jgi:hypothetical protein